MRYAVVEDTRDLELKIEELREEIEDLGGDEGDRTEQSEHLEEILELKSNVIQDLGELSWEHGVTLVANHYFTEYARELAYDCDLVKRDQPWPNSCIDWDRAAEELKQDYNEFDLGDTVYWGLG